MNIGDFVQYSKRFQGAFTGFKMLTVGYYFFIRSASISFKHILQLDIFLNGSIIYLYFSYAYWEFSVSV